MSNSLDLIIDISLEMWSVVVGFVPPFALQEILSALEDPSGDRRSTAYGWALVAFLANLSFAQKDLFKSWHTRRCYERTRGQLFCALHYKALKRQDVSGKVAHEDDEQGNADLGKIVNLMQSVTFLVPDFGKDNITDIVFNKGRHICSVPAFLGILWHICISHTAGHCSCVSLSVGSLLLFYADLMLITCCRILGWSSLSGALVVFVASYLLNYPLARYNITVRIDV